MPKKNIYPIYFFCSNLYKVYNLKWHFGILIFLFFESIDITAFKSCQKSAFFWHFFGTRFGTILAFKKKFQKSVDFLTYLIYNIDMLKILNNFTGGIKNG
jgi:hypothetical protein